jgi:TrpR-related protein YerC/YecD
MEQKIEELFEALLVLETKDEMARFIKDLCTPQEIIVLAERWQVCKLLEEGDLSYRQISSKTGTSLATITRIARFLKDESNQGYKIVLDRENIKKNLKNK